MTWESRQGADVGDVVESVRADIVRGRLGTGREVVVADLSEALNVSMSVAQQALLRLVDQHLVVASDTGSFHVVSTSLRDLRELTAIRQLLEGEAVRLSAVNGSAEWVRTVQAAFDALAVAGVDVEQPTLSDEWREAHTRFHEVLCAEAGNDRLLVTVGSLRDEAEIYRELSVKAMTESRRETVDREHRELLEHVLAGRPDAAAATLRAHLDGTMRSVEGSETETGSR
ncbi:GntR family transcriptional regulator [Salinibacterium hongtaonis]|nr:GntR family transcriptional regulator [Salinibacterium hongtaonis]